MDPRPSKFLVHWLQSLSPVHAFILGWLAIVGVFVLAVVWNYKKLTRRNFRSEGRGPHIPVDKRTLGRGSKQLPPR